MSAVLTFKGARLDYGELAVVEDLDLTCTAGEIVFLAGLSGSGKSTILRAAAGLLLPSAGRRSFEGKGISWVPQSDRLDKRHPVTAVEVVSSGLGARSAMGLFGGSLTAATRATVLDALESLGLGECAERPFASLSGGQRQRVLVARAVVARADLLVMDEPTSALDDEAAERVDRALRAEAERGAALLVATHDRTRLGSSGVGERVLVVESRRLREARAEELDSWTS